MAQDFFCGSANLRPQKNKQIQEDFVYCPSKCLQLGWPFFYKWVSSVSLSPPPLRRTNLDVTDATAKKEKKNKVSFHWASRVTLSNFTIAFILHFNA